MSIKEEIAKLKSEGLSYPKVAEALNKKGHKTPTGKAWTHMNVYWVHTGKKQLKKAAQQKLMIPLAPKITDGKHPEIIDVLLKTLEAQLSQANSTLDALKKYLNI